MKRRELLKLLGTGILLSSSSLALGVAKQWVKTEPLAISPEGMPRIASDDLECRARVVLVACGSSGLQLCSNIDKALYGLERVIALDTSPMALRRFRGVDQSILLTTASGRKPEIASELEVVVRAQELQIANAISGAHEVIVVSSFGGTSGTNLASFVAQIARKQGAFTAGFVGLPFGFESNNRHLLASAGLDRMLSSADSVVVIADTSPFVANQNMLLDTAVLERKQALANYLWNTCGCVARYGLVGMDFEDIRTTLGMPGLISRIGWGTASGAGRAADAIRLALMHPMLAGADLTRPKSVSVSIRSSHSRLRMREVNIVMGQLKSHIQTEETLVIFSADYDERLGEHLEVSVIVT